MVVAVSTIVSTFPAMQSERSWRRVRRFDTWNVSFYGKPFGNQHDSQIVANLLSLRSTIKTTEAFDIKK